MTEVEWLTSNDPLALTAFLTERRVSERKARWFGAACCRLLERWAPEWPEAVRISLLEDIADGHKDRSLVPERVASEWDPRPYQCWAGPLPWTIEDAALQAAFIPFPEQTAGTAFEDDAGSANLVTVRHGLDAVTIQMRFAFRLRTEGTGGWAEVLISLLRDIFGNPFRVPAFRPEWRTETAVAVARQMYASRDFSAMPILADALQDAGCDNDDLLLHCRGAPTSRPLSLAEPGERYERSEHVRGCWAVDLVLGNE